MSAHARAIAASLLACTLLATGCSRGGSSPADSNEIVIAQPADFPSMNPMYLQGYQSLEISALLYSRLLTLDGSGNLAPQLATAVPSTQNGGISADGRTLTYHLRHDAHWSDGVALTARDVLFTHRVQIDPKNTALETYGDREVAALDAPDDYTVRVHLAHPYASFVSLFLRPILPEHVLGASADLRKDPFNSQPVGSGPYTFGEWKRGDHLTFVADPHAWNGAPHIGRIRIALLPSHTTIELLLRQGSVDLASGFDRKDESGIDLSRDRIVAFPSRGFTTLVFAHDSPFADAVVRQAIALGTDRARIIHNASAGRDDPAHPYRGLLGWAYDASDPPLPYDLTRAKALLDSDGWRVGPDGVRVKDGKSLHLGLATLSVYPEYVSAVEQIQAQGKALGIAFEIKTYEEGTALKLITHQIPGATFDTFYLGLQSEYDPDPSWLVGCTAGKPNPYNISGTCDPALDALLARGNSTFDLTARKQIYASVQRHLQTTLPILMFGQSTATAVVSRRLQHFAPIPVGGALWNVASWTLTS